MNEHDDEDDGGLALPPGTRIEDYEILRVLGAGGFGITYLARDHRLQGDVALKEYLPADWAMRRPDGRVTARSRSTAADFRWGLERVLDEARILRRLDNPSVVRVLRHLDAFDTSFIVMEFVPGRTLERAVQQDGPWDEARLRPLLDSLLDASEVVHAAGLLHRDIKPANIILRPEGRPVLIDFGAARQAVGSQSRSVTAVVSPGFGPIEQYAAKSQQGPYTDIYALAATAYYVLTEQEPISAPDRLESDPLKPLTVAAAGRGRPAFLSALDAGLKVLARDRPQTIDAWRAAFPVAPGGAARPPIDRRLLIAASGGAALLAGAGLLLWPKGGGGGGGLATGVALPSGALDLAKPVQVRLPATALVPPATGDWVEDAVWTRCAFVGDDQAISASQGQGKAQRASVQLFRNGVSQDWTAKTRSRAFALAAAPDGVWTGGDDGAGSGFVVALAAGDLTQGWSVNPGGGKVMSLAAAAGRLFAALSTPQGGSVAVLDARDGRTLATFQEPGVTFAAVHALDDGAVCVGWSGAGPAARAFAARLDAAGQARWRYRDPDAARASRAVAATTDGGDLVLAGARARAGQPDYLDGMLRKLDLTTGTARPAVGGEVLLQRAGVSSLRGVAVAAPGVYYACGLAYPSGLTNKGSAALTVLVTSKGDVLSENLDNVAESTARAESVACRPGRTLLVSGFTAPGDRAFATPTLTRYVSLLKAG